MAGAFATIAILDGGGVSRNMRVWDESGAGTGPFTFATEVPLIDGSGTIAAGGTAQSLFGGTTPAHGFLVVNVDAANTLWLSCTTAAAANTAQSIPLAPMGGMFTLPINVVPLGAISIFGNTTGQQYTAIKW